VDLNFRVLWSLALVWSLRVPHKVSNKFIFNVLTLGQWVVCVWYCSSGVGSWVLCESCLHMVVDKEFFLVYWMF